MNTTTISPRRLVSALAVVAALGLAACGSDETEPAAGNESSGATDVTIADPWSRQPAEGQTRSAVYGVVTNTGDEAITAIAASTPESSIVELHETSMNDEGQMSMSQKEGGFEIPAGGSFTFEPGGPHIMLLEVDPATYPDNVDVTLEFDDGTSLEFVAEVREIGNIDTDMNHSDDDMDMDDPDHGDGEMDDDMDMDDGGTDIDE